MIPENLNKFHLIYINLLESLHLAHHLYLSDKFHLINSFDSLFSFPGFSSFLLIVFAGFLILLIHLD